MNPRFVHEPSLGLCCRARGLDAGLFGHRFRVLVGIRDARAEHRLQKGLQADSLDCVVLSESTNARGQEVFTIKRQGKPRVRYVFGNIGTDVRVLDYGRSWRRGFITCISRRIGLTCRNREDHGFTLSRERQRSF